MWLLNADGMSVWGSKGVMCCSGRSRRQQSAQLALRVPRGTEVRHLMLLSPCKLSAAFSEGKGTEVT